MSGQLFTQYFLTDGIRSTPEWESSDAAFSEFSATVARLYSDFRHRAQPNEAETEQDLIRPLLDALGWDDYLPQQSATGGEDIPDHLLFENSEAKERAVGRTSANGRYADALLVQESKRFELSLDNRDRSRSNPHDQILRYLDTADEVSDGKIRWGILSNGRVWRLYDRRKRPRSDSFFEADIERCLDLASNPDEQSELRAFYLFFRRESFVPRDGATTIFLEDALAEGKRYEERVSQDLSGVVFNRIFPSLVSALAEADGVSLLQADDEQRRALAECRDAALIFLYRLLFVLYAEDRGLLPVDEDRYDDYGLRKRGRDDVARRMRNQGTFSHVATSYYDHLTTLFRLIDEGDGSIGLPPYNGGLFGTGTAPLLQRVRLPDSVIAPIIYELSHTRAGEQTDDASRFVNYRDLSVQQLGSIEERLLEREPSITADGSVSIGLNSYARKDSGSYYTPQQLVDLIVDSTLKPLAEERLNAFTQRARELEADARPESERRAELMELDPAEAVLNLKILDPAMGSGHFLVTAVDFLSDFVAEILERTPDIPEWLSEPYESPLAPRIADIRADIIQRASASDWLVDEAQLTDHGIIRRMVLKRCIYGVDKNPMAVELAKVSLWLHSFTVGAPLSFLDHHLRCGDSLGGMSVSDAISEMNRLGGLFASGAIQDAERAAIDMEHIESMSDADVSEVRESAELFASVESATSDLRGLLNFLCGKRWLDSHLGVRARATFESPLTDALAAALDNAYELLSGGPGKEEGKTTPFSRMWRDASDIAEQERFLHWEVAFPGVWRDWQNNTPQGGFDAVIGNPPWDRAKMQEVEWFATREPTIARARTADSRKRAIKRLRQAGSPLADEFDDAKQRAEQFITSARNCGDYPLLGKGDLNLYSLFIERAMQLVNPNGFVGLLTPSGIYGDRGASEFFNTVSTSGRVASIFDFENQRKFFREVHASFKFCALIFGGAARKFPETYCAFYMHDTAEIQDTNRCFPLLPEDFARVNPNTKTSPVFRTRRDAEITRRIYESHPVLIDKSGDKERSTWPVKYSRMIDMTNDSALFLTSEQLETDGFYPIDGSRWRRGEELCLPLYEGKMVQAFDHRAASVVVNPENLNRPSYPRDSSLDEHSNICYSPTPLFWIDATDVDWSEGLDWVLGFKDVTAPTNRRTMIACLAPKAGFGNTLPLLGPSDSSAESIQSYKANAPLLAANLNALAFDFVARQKVQGQHLNLYVVEQLPVIALDDYDREFGSRTARDIVGDHVLQLTYTAHDMAPFARDQGYDGEPYTWDEEERRHLRARLDALYFHMYGISQEDVAYMLDTFPIVREEDEAAFGRYRTKEMVLAYMRALDAGDADTRVAV